MKLKMLGILVAVTSPLAANASLFRVECEDPAESVVFRGSASYFDTVEISGKSMKLKHLSSEKELTKFLKSEEAKDAETVVFATLGKTRTISKVEESLEGGCMEKTTHVYEQKAAFRLSPDAKLVRRSLVCTESSLIGDHSPECASGERQRAAAQEASPPEEEPRPRYTEE